MVLLDCGFSARETERRLMRLGIEPQAIAAILVTHEHDDHIGGVGALARRHELPVYLTAGTLKAARDVIGELPEARRFSPHEPFAIGDLAVEPLPVPHDAHEPAQFVFGDGDRRLGFLTDVGTITRHIERALSNCDALVLECNHDLDMLDNGSYPAALKARIRSDRGHLDNAAAAHLLKRPDRTSLSCVVAAHLSQTNNTPELARRALAGALDCEPDWVEVADPEQGLGWRDVSSGWI
jgi:phosphoribosyl 1,2-cyclic phosphodiesterase